MVLRQIYLGTNLHPLPLPVKIIKADNNFVAFEVPKNLGYEVFKVAVLDGSTWSNIVASNMPRAMQFDTPEIASNDNFRIFGRNLYVPNGALPTVSLVDNASGVQLASAINLSASDPYSLTVTAPAGIIAGHSYRALVSNGLFARAPTPAYSVAPRPPLFHDSDCQRQGLGPMAANHILEK